VRYESLVQEVSVEHKRSAWSCCTASVEEKLNRNKSDNSTMKMDVLESKVSDTNNTDRHKNHEQDKAVGSSKSVMSSMNPCVLERINRLVGEWQNT
jgi:hypothetical protein